MSTTSQGTTSSRYVLLGHLGKERSADAVRDSLIETVSGLPESLRNTLTWDQGAEMAEHRAFKHRRRHGRLLL